MVLDATTKLQTQNAVRVRLRFESHRVPLYRPVTVPVVSNGAVIWIRFQRKQQGTTWHQRRLQLRKLLQATATAPKTCQSPAHTEDSPMAASTNDELHP
jgi:hypothetical protein